MKLIKKSKKLNIGNLASFDFQVVSGLLFFKII